MERALASEDRIVEPLETRVERHRQEKEVRKLMKRELKRIASNRLSNKRRKKKVDARKAIIPDDVKGKIEVDPVVKELARRELQRRRLIEFIQEFHPRYLAGWVHHDICRRLEKFAADVAAGKNPRLMILMPPRHGKSQIASKMFPPWVLGHYNHFEVIACSYNVSLALEFSREARDIIESERYGLLFPGTRINQDARGAEAWRIKSSTGVGTGGYVAAGIGGPINGKGAHILIIDDPLKNAEEAESVEQRNKIWNWYQSTAYTRLAPGGGVLLIQTWWHDDDLAGRMQEEMKNDPTADQFEIIKYPAIAIEDEEFRMEGDPLHEARYDLEALMRIKRAVGPKYWSALYQQDPVPDDGAFFTKDTVTYRTGGITPRHMHIYQAWDFALGDKKWNDFNVGVTVGLDYQDTMHVLEVVRFKTMDSNEIADNFLDMVERWRVPGVQVVGAEDGKEWRGIQPYLKKKMQERRLYPTIEIQKPLTDKTSRARPLQGRMQQGKVTWPSNPPEKVAIVIKELLRFPSGVHDDGVDAMAWVSQLVVNRQPPKPPRPDFGPRPETVAQKIRRLGRGGTGGTSAMAA